VKVLALDPGTTCGWATYDTETRETACGSWDLGIGGDESADIRLLKLTAALHSCGDVGLIVYEANKDSRFARSVRIYGQLEGAIMLWARQHLPPVPYSGVNPAQVQKWLLGKKYRKQLKHWQATEKAKGHKKPKLKDLKMHAAYTHLGFRQVDDHDAMDAFVVLCFFVAELLPTIHQEASDPV